VSTLPALLGALSAAIQAHPLCRRVAEIETREFAADQFRFKIRAELAHKTHFQVSVYFNRGHIDYAYQLFLARPNGRNPIKSKPQRRRGRRENKTAGVGTGFCCHLGRNPGSKRRWMDATVDQTSSAALASGIPAQMNGAQRRSCGTAKARVHWSPSVKSVVSAFSVSACSASPR